MGERCSDVDWDVRTACIVEDEFCATAECLKLPSLRNSEHCKGCHGMKTWVRRTLIPGGVFVHRTL